MTNPPPRRGSASHVSPRRPDGSRGRTGPHLGPLQITPVPAALAIAFLGSLLYIGWAVFKVKDSTQIPMITSGTAVLGLVFASLSLGGAIRMWRAWRDEAQGQTVLFALLGGIAGMAALGCLAGALVLALIWGS